MDTDPPIAPDRLPQPMGHRPTPPTTQLRSSKGLEADIDTIEQQDRQQKSKHLRTIEDSYEHYDDDKPKKKPKHRLIRFLGWMLLIIVLTAAGGAAGWHFWLSKEAPQTAASNGADARPTPAPQPVTEQAEPTSLFSSTAFGLRFDYPQSWKTAEAVDNKITAVSPAMELTLAGGKTQTGQVVLTIQHKQSSLPEFSKGDALAVLQSDKIVYAKPSQAQRASSYLSYLNYAGSTTRGIDGVYVSGDNGYQIDQAVPMADVAKADPLITITFRTCADSKCASAGQPAAIANSAWQDVKFSKPLKTMLQSIVVD